MNQEKPTEVPAASATPREGTPQKARPLTMTGADKAPVFYANVGVVVSTPFDIQLHFGEIIEFTNEKVEGRIIVRVVMTPEHAALLLGVLSVRLQEYAKTIGKLRRVPVERAETLPQDLYQASSD